MRRDHQRLVNRPREGTVSCVPVFSGHTRLSPGLDGRTESEFLSDETLRYAVAQRLTVVGEAVARLSAEIKERHGSTAWADIVAFRDIQVHEYFGIHWPFVWQTVIDDAPALREQIARIVASEFPA